VLTFISQNFFHTLSRPVILDISILSNRRLQTLIKYTNFTGSKLSLPIKTENAFAVWGRVVTNRNKIV
jgi:hypothetical protein